jgi:DNA-binding beta-propeller fold protein YncE
MKLRAAARGRVQCQSLLAFVLVCLALGAGLACATRQTQEAHGPLTQTRTLAGATGGAQATRFGNPFGVAVAMDGAIYVTDGEQNRLSKIAPDGTISVVVEHLNTPSAISAAPDGTLVVADTGSHTIKRIEPQAGASKIIAGVDGRAGFRDGAGTEALFDGPIGVAVRADGTIFVADTYNDRIRAIDPQGTVRTLAGGPGPGFADAADGAQARFHTPCGIALLPDGALVVADTGNQRLRRVELNGAVTTIAGTGEAGSLDGLLTTAHFDEPTGVAVDNEGTIYVAEAGGSVVRACTFKFMPQVLTLAGGAISGFADGKLEEARFNHPSGVAIAPDGTLVVADTGNGAVRAILSDQGARGRLTTKEEAQSLRPTAADFRRQGAPRWPYEPPTRTREIAATFGEIRGEMAEGKSAWFHNGLDIPGAYGETVRLVREERVLNPLAVEGTGTARERVRFPSLGYIHLRVGRERDDRPLADERFRLLRDDVGRVQGVRIRRGAQFKAGDALGTLNNQYHVHLIAGPVGSEFNALAALELPGVRDTVAPVIEKDGVLLSDRNGRAFDASSSNERARRENTAPVNVSGDVRITVRAYDQMDGNAARRRLGLYRLGYQIMSKDGRPAPGFDEPLMSISFESLPDDPATARFAYAVGSQSGYTDQTVFAYIVTNRVRDREAGEDYWHAAQLAPGEYIVRVYAEDFFGNRTTRDVPVRVVS